MKEKLLAFAQKMGLLAKVKDGTATADDWNAFATAFQAEHNVDILAAIDEANKAPRIEAQHQQILTALFGAGNSTAAPEAGADPNAAILAAITAMNDKIQKLERTPDVVAPVVVHPSAAKVIIPINSRVSTETHLFGIESDFFSLSRPWNRVSATGMPIASWGKKDESAFMASFNDYASSFAGRVNELQKTGELNTLKATAIDFSGFTGTGWGESYIVRRQDALIAYMRTLPSVRDIFPVRYGVQDKMVMTNSFLTQFSQAYQKGKVFKGEHKVEPVLAEVFDVMFKHQFEDMKTLEREYIGYLNREGSQPIKWSMVEWLMANTLTALNNEWNERRINGYRIEPTTSVAGHHLFGSNGVIRTMWKYVEDFYLLPYTDLKTYTASTILTFVETLVEYVNQELPSMNGYWLYMNQKHIPWFKAAYRTKYGTDLDFTGSKLEVKDYDNLAGIKAIPNMKNSCLMLITLDQNVELYEDQAGEMSNFYFERELETLIAASWWKEGAGAYMIGKKYASAAALAAAGRKDQYIFMTYPVVDLAAGATTCDGTKGDRFISVANSGATAITNITSASEGIVYRIECGSATNASAIAKANYFSTITAAWTPTAVGDYLEVYWDATTSKFVEVRRLVTS